jgi:hypothetical protein
VEPPSTGCRLDGAKRFLILWALTLLTWVALAGDGVWRSRSQDRAAAELCARLHLTAPAYYPAGHPLRHPEIRASGIVAGHTPRLPLALTQPGPQWMADSAGRWETLP